MHRTKSMKIFILTEYGQLIMSTIFKQDHLLQHYRFFLLFLNHEKCKSILKK